MECYGMGYEAWDKDQWRILENTVTKFRVPEKNGKFLDDIPKKNGPWS